MNTSNGTESTKCSECGKRGIISYEWYDGRACQKCVNNMRKWHGWLNHNCLCFDNGVPLP